MQKNVSSISFKCVFEDVFEKCGRFLAFADQVEGKQQDDDNNCRRISNKFLLLSSGLLISLNNYISLSAYARAEKRNQQVETERG